MARFAALALAVAAALSGVDAFNKPCQGPFDVCGWMLAGGEYGYEVSHLQAVVAESGEDPAIAWDSVYTCHRNGEIGWSYYCGGAGTCNAGIAGQTDALCNENSPDTGDESDWDEGDEGEWDDGGDWDDDYEWDSTQGTA